MSWKKFVPALLLIVLLLVPTAALAVDFEISDVVIDTQLKANGDADVVEKHTYVFDSEFNGITRELVAKEGAAIADFEAYEKGKLLKVENDSGTYKVFRSGKNETVEIEMRYRIVDAVEIYTDGAQFYWPFFDKRNETDYENMTINIHPPAAAKDVQYLGYDTAYEKGMTSADGDVSFVMGKVPSGKNGDVRVVYEPELFTGVAASKGTIRNEVKSEETRLADEIEAYIVNQGKVEKFGFFAMTGFGIILVGLFGWVITSSRLKKREVNGQLNDAFIPMEELSMSATIYYTNYGVLNPEATSAALLDLVRKGYVKQLSDEEFELVVQTEQNPHEDAFIELLFDKIGDGKIFRIADLETYTKVNKNHKPYSESLVKWRTAIAEEVKEAGLRENRNRLRWTVAILSLAYIPIMVQLGRYELYSYMVITILFAVVGLSFATFYSPRNIKGLILLEEWKQFRKRFANLDMNEWKRLSTNDQFRAYTYSIGVKDKNMERHFNEFSEAESRVKSRESGMYIFNPVFVTQSFTSANANASVSASGTSTSSSSGGGTGGGGGGSGAF